VRLLTPEEDGQGESSYRDLDEESGTVGVTATQRFVSSAGGSDVVEAVA
jgi:hypothetical protein